MLTLPPSVRVFVAREPVDMRKSFDGLSALASTVIEQDPQSGHLFVFVNKHHTRMKILVWDRTGYWLLYKRLEHGRFALFERPSEKSGSYELRSSELAAILDGIDLRGAKRHADHLESRRMRSM